MTSAAPPAFPFWNLFEMESKMSFRHFLIVGALAIATMADAREITDPAGRTTTIPDEIKSVVTIGGVPMLNTYIFIAGQGQTLEMGFPMNWDHAIWQYQYVFAPQLADNPLMQDPGQAPNLEKIIAASPDLILSNSRASIDLLESNGLTGLMMRLNTPDEIKAGVQVMGEVFDDPGLGERYAGYFDGIQERIAGRLADIPEAERRSVLYMNPSSMTQPNLISEWWLAAGGGASVTKEAHSENVLPLSVETVIDSDPDFIFVMSPPHVGVLREHPVLSQLGAVRNDRVMAAPIGAHRWGAPTVEMALTPLWLATVLYPDQFPRDELVEEVDRFYADFFKTELTTEQVETILSGGAAVQ